MSDRTSIPELLAERIGKDLANIYISCVTEPQEKWRHAFKAVLSVLNRENFCTVCGRFWTGRYPQNQHSPSLNWQCYCAANGHFLRLTPLLKRILGAPSAIHFMRLNDATSMLLGCAQKDPEDSRYIILDAPLAENLKMKAGDRLMFYDLVQRFWNATRVDRIVKSPFTST